MDLIALEQLRRLKYRFFRTLDLKDWASFADTLTEDVVGNYGTQVYGDRLRLDGRDTIAGFMQERLPTTITTMHVAHHPELEVQGDEAEGSWAIEDTVIVTDLRVLIRGAGYYRDRYRRDSDGAWRIAATEYDRVYEAMQSLDDTPSFQLIANRWAGPTG
jgi:hypothetical protein